MANFTIPSFNVGGIVGEKRELKGGKENKIFAYLIKVQALGGMFELQTSKEEVYKSVGEGQIVDASGRFEFYQGRAKFILDKIKAVAALILAALIFLGAPASASAAPPSGWPSTTLSVTAPTASGLGTETLTWNEAHSAYETVTDPGVNDWFWSLAPSYYADESGIPKTYFALGGPSGEYDVIFSSDVYGAGSAGEPYGAYASEWGAVGFQLGVGVPEPATVAVAGVALTGLLLRRPSSRVSETRCIQPSCR